MLDCRFSGVVCGRRLKMISLSLSSSRTLLLCPRPRIIQAVSIALRKPRARPVPVGQKGCEGRRGGRGGGGEREGGFGGGGGV